MGLSFAGTLQLKVYSALAFRGRRTDIEKCLVSDIRHLHPTWAERQPVPPSAPSQHLVLWHWDG